MRLTPWTLARESGRIVVALCAAAASMASSTAQELTRLEINSPFAGITASLDGDSSGSYLVTSNSARSLTIWTRTGEKSWQPNVIRAPRRDEFASATYLGAITPDGKYLAFAVPPLSDGKGGYKAGTAQIYILDRADEHLITTFSTGIPTKVAKLRFSADGQYLGAILGYGCGYRIWTREQWTAPAKEQAPKWVDDKGYADAAGTTRCSSDPADSNSVSLPSGSDLVFTGHSEAGAPWLLTLTDNGFRSYAKSGDEIVQTGQLPLNVLKLNIPHRIALTADIDNVAIGDNWGASLAILRRDGAKYEFSQNLPASTEKLSEAGKKRSNDGAIYLPNPVWVERNGHALIYAFGYFQPSNLAGQDPNDQANSIVVFDPKSGDTKLIGLHDDDDSTLLVLHKRNGASDNIFFVSTKQLSVLDLNLDNDTTSPVLPIAATHALDLRGTPEFGLLLASKTKRLYLPTLSGDDKYRTVSFDYGAMSLMEVREFNSSSDFNEAAKAYTGSPDYYNAVASPDQWTPDSRIDNPVPTFFGHQISIDNLDHNETSYSRATVPGGTQMVWGTDRTLRVVNSEGKFDCVRPIESPAWRMNITPDPRMVIVAHGDGVLRWYRLTTGDKCLALVASLYLTQIGGDAWGFLAWLPNGKFMTSGGAGSKSIACYPVAKPNGLTSCVDFQQTGILYDRDAVVRAINAASSDEGAPPDPHVQTALAKGSSEQKMSVRWNGDIHTDTASYPVTVTVDGWKEGTRYLRFSAAGGVDLPFTYKGTVYGSSKPLPLSAPGDFDLVFSLPEILHHKRPDIQILPLVYSAILSDGSIDPASSQELTRTYSKNVTWTGLESPKTKKRKLWALLVGFSGSSYLATPALQYTHDDVLNFARFLELATRHQLPDEMGGTAAPSYFDDMKIQLLLSSQSTPRDNIERSRIKMLEDEIGYDKFVVIYPQPTDKYDALVAAAIDKLLKDIGEFSTEHQDDGFDWEHRIVIYFSGHGFSMKNDNPAKPYMRMGLVTPDTQNTLEQGSVWLDQILATLLRSQYFSVVILDACRGAVGLPLDADLTNIALYPDLSTNLQTQLHILYSSDVGHYSYEYPDYGVVDFVPKFTLWPPALESKGGGLFSLGLLASLVCEEALDDDPDFTLKNTNDFFRRFFFSGANPKWPSIQAALAAELKAKNLQLYPPKTKYFASNAGTLPAVLRQRASKAPLCFPTKGQ